MSGDRYWAAQAGAMGPGARASNITFQQVWNQCATGTDLPTLARELSTLRESLMKQGTTVEHAKATGEVALAEDAAVKGDGPTMLHHLAKAGKWALDATVGLGLDLAKKSFEKALGL